MAGPDLNEIVFAEFDGFVVKETLKAFGIGSQPTGRAAFFVPKSIAGRIKYVKTGWQLDVLVGSRVQGFEVRRWFARQQQLIGSLE